MNCFFFFFFFFSDWFLIRAQISLLTSDCTVATTHDIPRLCLPRHHRRPVTSDYGDNNDDILLENRILLRFIIIIKNAHALLALTHDASRVPTNWVFYKRARVSQIRTRIIEKQWKRVKQAFDIVFTRDNSHVLVVNRIRPAGRDRIRRGRRVSRATAIGYRVSRHEFNEFKNKS